MRQRFEAWLNQIWYEGAPAPAWLRALVPLYRLGFLLDKRVNITRRPAGLSGQTVIVVGGITAGGSGKTPLVIRLCQILQNAGFRPGVASRGYRRKRHGLIRVTRESTAAEVGDEPLVIARRTGVPVMVAEDRCTAAQALLASGVNVVVADDGLQHHRLPRSLEICVVDGLRGFGNRLQMPAGPLREPLDRLHDVDYLVVNGAEHIEGELDSAIPMQLIPERLHALIGEQSWRLSQFSGCRVNAVAGISHPQRFFRSLQQAGLQVSPYAFADHHAYRSRDFAAMEPGLPIIMTEKDAVKCRGMPLENAWYLVIEASLPPAWTEDLLQKLESCIGPRGSTG